jgi:glycosyltransferase involved in cell wall biosynthesis
MPKVSVLLTSFNHGKYLREAIDSVLNQTFTDFELIILDDASTDNSWNLIRQYADPRIKALRNETNVGYKYWFSNAMPGMGMGGYIAIHHSDDVWEPTKLEEQVAYLDAHPEIGAVFTNALVITEDSALLADEKHFYFGIFNQPNRTRHEWLRHFFYRGNALCHPSVLIRRECYEVCGPYRHQLAQLADFDMWIRLCLKYDIHVLPKKLVRYRVRENEANVSGNRPETRIRSAYEYYQVLRNYRDFSRFDEFLKVFPAAAEYDRGEETDMDFALGMVALAREPQKPFRFTQLFGQDLLFEAISDPKRAANIKRLYGFDHRHFSAFTGKNDVFTLEKIGQLRGKLEKIHASRSWRLTRPLRWLERLAGKIFG